MLFPGAVLVISFLLVVVGAAFSLSAGAFCGIIVGLASKHFINKSETYNKKISGNKPPKGGWPWWISERYYVFSGWGLFSFIIAYSIAGPIWALIEWLK